MYLAKIDNKWIVVSSEDIVSKEEMKSTFCGSCYCGDENGTTFCRKKKGHKGFHSALVEWEDEYDDEM